MVKDSADLLLEEIIKEIDEADHHAWYKDELIDYLKSKLGGGVDRKA